MKTCFSKVAMTKSLLPMSHRTIPSVFLSFVLLAAAVCADEPVADDTQHVEFFETKIRPLLVNQCYECHSGVSKSLKAGLRLDSKSAMLKGGDSGPAIVPGKPTDSLLIQSVRYESNEMPPNGKLGDAQIAALTKWVEAGCAVAAGCPRHHDVRRQGIRLGRSRETLGVPTRSESDATRR